MLNNNKIKSEVERIIRVDHAGEYGAIHIYQTQWNVSQYLNRDILPELDEMLSHEREHFKTFQGLLDRRKIRHCYALSLWALGGSVLGFTTALLGKKAIWVCTNAIETTVLNHLEEQLAFLSKYDQEAYAAVLSIQKDEISHQQHGQHYGTGSSLYKPLYFIISRSTEFAIWLSSKL